MSSSASADRSIRVPNLRPVGLRSAQLEQLLLTEARAAFNSASSALDARLSLAAELLALLPQPQQEPAQCGVEAALVHLAGLLQNLDMVPLQVPLHNPNYHLHNPNVAPINWQQPPPL